MTEPAPEFLPRQEFDQEIQVAAPRVELAGHGGPEDLQARDAEFGAKALKRCTILLDHADHRVAPGRCSVGLRQPL